MIDINNISFTYGEENSNGGVCNINLHVDKGEFIVLTGGSGCGKTTITRIINGLIPHYYEGNMTGSVMLDSDDITSKSISEISQKVASVFQNPRSQFFSVDSTGELAFQLENRGIEPQIIVEKMNRVINEFRIEKLMGRNLFNMSGGEKQKLACAGVELSGADIIVLDEPSSNLDLDTIEELRKILSKWKNKGETIVISEHRLYYLRDLIDRMILLENGQIKKTFTGEQAKQLSVKDLNSIGLRTLSTSFLELPDSIHNISNDSIIFHPFQFYYKNTNKGISINELNIKKKSVVAIVGHNGAGKSTFAKCLCGLEKNVMLL